MADGIKEQLGPLFWERLNMSSNAYAPCPCGSGKKIKFCCGDLASDIERISQMIEGDQRVAALRLIDQLLAKHPDRVALLDIKVAIAIELGQLEDASNAVDAILKTQSNHESALLRKAQIESLQGNVMNGVVMLQKGIQACDGNVPLATLDAYLSVGQALWHAGHIIAARAHLNTHFFIQSKPNDPRGLSAIIEMNHSGGLPLLIKDDLHLVNGPADVEWKDDFNDAVGLAGKLKWRKAVEAFEKLLSKSDNAPEVVFNLSIIKGWLADSHGFVEGLRQYSTMDVDEEKAVESLCIASLLDHGHEEDMIDRIQRTYQLTDADALVEHLSDNPNVRRLPTENAPADENSAPPVAQYTLLDRPMPEASDELTDKDIPEVLGLFSVFGKETDQAPRLVFVTTSTEDLESYYQQLDNVAGDFIGEPEDQVVGKLDRIYNAMAPRWQMPEGVSAKQQYQLIQQQLSESITKIWPTIPQRILGGKSPEEVAKDSGSKVPLLAAVLILETTSLASSAPDAIAKLREKLSLESPTSIDATADDFNAWDLPLSRLPRLEMDKASDKDLVQLYRRTKIAGVGNLMAHVLKEFVKRPSLEDSMSLMEAYSELVQAIENPDETLTVIEEARQATEGEEHSRPMWDIAAINVYLEIGEAEKVMKLMEGLQRDFPNDRNVSQAIHQVLSTHGIFNMAPGGVPADGGEDPALQTASASGEIWTPGQENSGSDQEDKPAIWTP